MKKILVIDDDLDILTLVEITLSMNDFEVKTVSRWEEIYDSIDGFNPDLILLDVSLNGADGREICKKIKKTAVSQHIPVILFSANSDMSNYVEECQAETFIAKPFKLSYLVQTIKSSMN